MENTKNITTISTIKGRYLFAIYFFFLLALLLSLWACASRINIPQKKLKNLAYLYNPDQTYLHPEYQVYNINKDSSIIFLKFPARDLMYEKLTNGEPSARLYLKYVLYQSLSTGGILDSASFITPISIAKQQGFYQILKFKLKTPYLSKTYLKIELKDLVSERRRSDYIDINKTGGMNRQSVLVYEKSRQLPLFGNELLIGKNYYFEISNWFDEKLFISHQNPIKKVADVPYSKHRQTEQTSKPDTIYAVNNKVLKPLKRQTLRLLYDTNSQQGIWFLCLDSINNYMHTPTQMLQPLVYLLSPKEFKKITHSKNKKNALDRFWLQTGKNKRVAREMIKVFYHRVTQANRYFTSYQEGWRTDRGMVYTIYGEPSTIYKSDKMERWIYSKEESLIFDFHKTHHPYSNKHFVLQRNDQYQRSWLQAVDAWRNGKVFSISS